MAHEKLTDRTLLTTPAGNDWVHVVDVSDTTADTAGNSKKVTITNLMTLAPVQAADIADFATESYVDTQVGIEESARITADSNLQTQITANDSGISALTSGLSTLDGEVTTLEGRVTTAETNITSNDSDINTLQTTVTSLDTRVTTNEGNIVSLDGQVQTNSTDIGLLDGDLDALTTRVTTAEGNITSNDSDINTLQVGLAQEITDRVADVNTEEARATAAETNLQSQITANDGDISALDARVTQNETDIAANAAAIPANLTDLNDTPAGYGTSGQVLTSNGSGTIWTTPSTGGGGGAVDSVNGFTGVVVLDTDNISEGSTNLYYTEVRVAANSAVVANTAKNSYPTADATKLAGIDAGAQINVNADWDATSGDAQIFNKPTLSAVATSGAYGDLSGTPTIPTDLVDLGDTPATYGLAGQVLATNAATNGTEWITISGGGGAVDSVNGQTGVVVLDTDDISEGANNLYYTDVRVNTYLASRNISASYPTTEITGNALLTSAHEQKMLVCKSVGGMTLAVPAGLGRDAEILVYQWGTGSVTIVPDTGVTIVTTSVFLPITAEQYAIIGLKQIGTTDVWVITGERRPS